jgi:hypothetical protein
LWEKAHNTTPFIEDELMMLCNKKAKHCRYVFFLIAVMQLQGCQIHVSEAYFETSENKEWHSENNARFSTLTGQDISIYLRASNTNPHFSDKDLNHFGISLWFDTESRDFKFNPNDVFMTFSGAEKLNPVKVIIKSAGLRSDAAGWRCGNYPIKNFGPGPSYALHRGFCVELYFGITPPPPETSFSMHLEGLTRNNKRVVVPEIRFRKGSFWQIG